MADESPRMKVLRCNCSNKFQDKEYGNGMRAHNPTMKTDSYSKKVYRCTVCSTEHGGRD